tara:strand:+ start:567 stop:1187 length:621 start_codon:yes stop_codon:yes gene_type:complete
MEAIKVHITPCEEEDGVLHPLYQKYEQEIEGQPAYVELDVRTGSLYADWDAEVGNGVPADVWHGLRRRYGIINILTTEEINTLLTELAPIAQRIVDGTDIQSDGLQDRPVLSEQAQAAEEALTEECDGVQTQSNGVVDADEWFGPQEDAHVHIVPAKVTAESTDEQLSALVEEAQLDGRTDGWTITGLGEYFEERRDYLRELEEDA